MDCLVDSDKIASVYANLFVISILAIILIIMCILIWTIRKIFTDKMTWINYIERIEGNCIVLLFLVYPTILKITLQMFACSEIEGVWYLDIYMNDECWTGNHALYLLTIALPSLIIWVIGLPLFALYRMSREDR